MKLCNKKTGEIEELWYENISLNFGSHNKVYHSLAELNADWEDYKPAEPLIKDEKIRKALSTWAKANDITQLSYDACWNAFRSADFLIAFNYDFDRHDGLEDGREYTIAELCGEEE